MIKEDIYVMQPEGYVKKGKESCVLKLSKAHVWAEASTSGMEFEAK